MRKFDMRVQMAVSRKRPLEDKLPEAEPKRKKRRKHRGGLDDEIYNETSYYIQNGLRYVKPYYFSFTSHTKGRWVGSLVYDVFCREFQAERPEYYEKAIKAGKVTVNSEVATMETVLQHNDLLVHQVHRHEPPVTARPIKILHLDDNIVAVNKPSSIPVHPCGRYRHNSVVFILGKEHNFKNLHTIHRLDRLTSGLLLFARSLATAQRLEQQIRERRVSKEYVCKVHGEFPIEPVICREPIKIVTHKLGVCRVDPTGKTCSTRFSRLSYDGHTSIVKCEPETGRMHQIRVHLQWLGHPIVNDPLYGHPAWGPQRGRRGEGVGNMEQVIKEIVESNYNSEEFANKTTCTNRPSGTTPPLHVFTTRMTDTCPDMKSLERLQDKLRQLGDDNVSAETREEEEESKREEEVESKEEREEERDEEVESKEERDEEVESKQEREEEAESKQEREEEVESKEEREEERDEEVESKEERDEEVESKQEREEEAESKQEREEEVESKEEREEEVESAQDVNSVNNESVHDPDCTECRLVHPDPTPDQLMMYLHALRYTGPDWEYCTELPSWADYSAENPQLQLHSSLENPTPSTSTQTE